jgi:predicted DNA repair protein MutK
MAGGLFALLDDVAALARIAAASVDDVGAAAGRASMKAAGVVVDDTAVTPQYLHGSPAARELPIIKKIAIGSLRNKLLFILPAAVLLGQFLPQLLPVILIFGGGFLAYEGAHKVWEKVRGHEPVSEEAEDQLTSSGELSPEHEAKTVAGAIRTDFILSAEIMVIALKEVVSSDPDASIWMRAIVLAAVAVLITVLVYGVVALIVKMDDVGLHLAEKPSKTSQRVGLALVSAMPRLLTAISLIGTLAMLWVGGHIFLVSLYEIGGHDGLLEGTAVGDVLHAPYDLIHHWEEEVHDAVGGALGSLLGWLLNTVLSGLVGLVVGGIVLVVLHAFGIGGGHGSGHGDEHGDEHAEGHADGHAEGHAAEHAAEHPDEHAADRVDPPAEDSPNR